MPTFLDDTRNLTIGFLVHRFSPTTNQIKDLGRLRLVSKSWNAFITRNKSMTLFWFSMLRRTAHTHVVCWACYPQRLRFTMEYQNYREHYGECQNQNHFSGKYLYERQTLHENDYEAVCPRARDLYTEWRCLAYKRIGRRVWGSQKEKQLQRLERKIQEMRELKRKAEWLDSIYKPVAQSEDRRIRKQLSKRPRTCFRSSVGRASGC